MTRPALQSAVRRVKRGEQGGESLTGSLATASAHASLPPASSCRRPRPSSYRVAPSASQVGARQLCTWHREGSLPRPHRGAPGLS